LPGAGFGLTQTPGGGGTYWATAGLTINEIVAERERTENFFTVRYLLAASNYDTRFGAPYLNH